MQLTVNNRQVFELQLEQVTLRQLVGSYELLLRLHGTVSTAQESAYWMVIYSAQVRLSSIGGSIRDLGVMRPDRPVRIQQGPYSNPATVELKTVLQPHQIDEIESIRNASDLLFQIAVLGEGGDGSPSGAISPVYGDFAKQVPQSDWVSQLRQASALDVLLLEVPMPVADVPPKFKKIADHLKRAQKLFVDGSYPECIGHCRTVMDAINSSSSAEKRTEALKKLNEQVTRKAMTKSERLDAISGAVRHYTHLAHHADTEESQQQFTRGEAKLILALSASLAAQNYR